MRQTKGLQQQEVDNIMQEMPRNGVSPQASTLRSLLEARSGHSMQSAADCEWMAMDIKSKLHDGPSVTTLKRLLGFLPDDKQHRDSTMSFIAHYLGYKNNTELQQALTKCASDFGTNDGVLENSQLETGDHVEIAYQPDRTITFEYEGDDRFLVTQSINSQLQPDDEVVIRQFAIGFPLLADNVVRNGKSLGSYTAGKIGGLTSIKH